MNSTGLTILVNRKMWQREYALFAIRGLTDERS